MESELERSPPLLISTRFLLAILTFFGSAIQYAQRIDMSVAIVCMVNNTAILLDNSPSFSNTSVSLNRTIIDQCPNSINEARKFDGEFLWPKKVQGYILGAYFYGYMLTNLPGGYLSLKLGAKYVILFSILVGSAATMLIPYSANLHFGALIAARAIIGFAHGFMWPAIATNSAHWVVPHERGRLIAFGGAGAQIGNVIALLSGGYLCETSFAGGWPLIFYILGIAGMIWCVAWLLLTSNSPATHRFISDREREYIMQGTNVTHEKSPTPWKSIFTSKAVLSLYFGHVCAYWGTYLFITNIPSYMKEVLRFDIKANGALSSLPYLVFWIVIIVSGIVADHLLKVKQNSSTLSKLDEKRHMDKRRKMVRRVFNALGFLVPMGAIIALSFVTCQHPYVGVGLLVLGIAFFGFQYGGGYSVNYNDISGKYSGVVLGLGNSIASISGILAPYFVGFMTKNQKHEEWRMVFLVTAGIYLIGALVLIIFSEAKSESWAEVSSNENEITEESIPLKVQEKN